MGKRIGSVFLCVIYVMFTGCYQVSQVSMEEFMSEHHPSEAKFHASDGLTYHTGASGYRVVEDSLYIRGVQILSDETRVPYLGKIPVDSISTVNVETIHTARTGALIGLAVLVVIAVSFLVSFGKFNFDGGILGSGGFD